MLQYMKMAPGRSFCDVIAVKAIFLLTPEGVDTSPSPGKFCMADMPRQPEQSMFSSLFQAGATILGKPGSDLYFSGQARRPRPAKRWPVSVGLGPAEKPLAAYECMAVEPRVYHHESECDDATMPRKAFDAWLGWYASTPDAPCIAICSTSQGDAYCKGCGRTFDEVQNWTVMSPAEKRVTWRRITLDATAWRFNRYAERARESKAQDDPPPAAPAP